MIYVDDSACRC